VVKRVKSYGERSYMPEKKQKGRCHWQGQPEEQRAVYDNRRRVRGEYGKSLLRRRGDGGVALDTVAEIVRAGTEILVAGNAVFGQGNPKTNAEKLLKAAGEATKKA
jgi:pentose-5-phosphate-3-epimerase